MIGHVVYGYCIDPEGLGVDEELVDKAIEERWKEPLMQSESMSSERFFGFSEYSAWPDSASMMKVPTAKELARLQASAALIAEDLGIPHDAMTLGIWIWAEPDT